MNYELITFSKPVLSPDGTLNTATTQAMFNGGNARQRKSVVYKIEIANLI